MMPSRGLQLPRRLAAQAYQLQCRNLSSTATRRLPRATRYSHSQNTRPNLHGQWTLRAAVALPAIRYASTTPTPPPPASAAPPLEPPPTESTTSGFNIDSITLDNLDLPPDISNIPEHIGYLKEIGLDYGYGPTSMIEWTLEHIHIYTGLPWWGAIALSAVLFRVVTLPLYLKSSDQTARQAALVSVTKPLTDKMSAAQKAGNTQEVQIAWMELRAVRKRAGLNFMTMFTPIILQGVIGFCSFKLLRAMANLPVPALHTDGFFWLQDLTMADPYLLLPAMMGLSIHVLFRFGGETGAMADQMGEGMKKFMLYGMPVMIMLVTGWQPGTVCIWFVASGALGVVQAKLLQSPAVRNYFGLAPIYKPSAAEKGAGPMAAIMESMRPTPRKPALDVKGTSRPTGQTSKNAGYMSPQYQAPNLSTRASPNSPKKFTAPGEDIKSPYEGLPPAKGVLEKAGEAYKGVGEQWKEYKSRVKGALERGQQRKSKESAASFKKRAEEFERRAVEREKRR